jgi:hypothetical protein
MKLREIIEKLEELEKVAGNMEVIIYAYGGDYGGFVYPGDALLSDALILKDQNVRSLNLPNCDLPNCGVDENAKDLMVLNFKYSIEVDEIGNGCDDFDLDLIDPEDNNTEWLNTGKIYNFKKKQLIEIENWSNNN